MGDVPRSRALRRREGACLRMPGDASGAGDDRREADVAERDNGTGTGDRRLRVLMLSWEYPPVLVGGLGRHVHALATSLAAAGHEVTVVTRHAADARLEEI